MGHFVHNLGPKGPLERTATGGRLRVCGGFATAPYAPRRGGPRGARPPGKTSRRGARTHVVPAHPRRRGRSGNDRAAWLYHHHSNAKPSCRRPCSGSWRGGPWCPATRRRPCYRPRWRRGSRAMSKRTRGWAVYAAKRPMQRDVGGEGGEGD